ncbi:MAG TPA: HEAT repeat domain-containing protein [Allocoleopsis sp.]
MKIDWEALAIELGTLTDFGGEIGGSHLGTQAIEHILGAEFFHQAVEHYISCKPGSELARSVLLRLKPWSGMKHCYEIFKHSKNLDDRRSAIELLRVVGDRRVLAWIPEFLADPDPGIQAWGIGVIDQLLFWQLLSDKDVKTILEPALTHHNSYIREQAALLLTTEEEEQER